MAQTKTPNSSTNSKVSQAQQRLDQFQKSLLGQIDKLNTQATQELSQENTALNQFINAETSLISNATEFGGPSPNFTPPTWSTYQKKFQPVIQKILSTETVAQKEKDFEAQQLLEAIKEKFQDLFDPSKLFPSTKTKKDDATEASLEGFVEWIQDSIIELRETIYQNQQEEILDQLTKIVFTNISKFKSGQDAFATIWKTYFEKPILNILDAPINPGKIQKEVEYVLTALKGSLREYQSSNEESIRNWVETTVSGIPKSIVSSIQKEEIVTSLEDVITSLFPQADQIFFYTDLKKKIYQRIHNGIPKSERLTKQSSTVNNNSSNPTAKTNTSANSSTSSSTKKSPATKNDPVNSTNTKPDAGNKNKVAPDFNDGLEALIDSLITNNQPDKKKLVQVLTENISQLIQTSLSDTFEELNEQGSQGLLISSTYDYQIISRISDYTSTLLNELKNDYEKIIPENSAQSLKAAKEVTAAAVSFREFSASLTNVVAEFEGEQNQDQTGTNYLKIKALIEGPYENNPNIATLNDLANVLYLGIGQPEPIVKMAEYEGVKLAADSAGLNTSLQKLLITEKDSAISALENLKSNSKTSFQNSLKNYQSSSEKYFESLDSFISTKQTYEYDQLKRTAITKTLDLIFTIIDEGYSNFKKAGSLQ